MLEVLRHDPILKDGLVRSYGAYRWYQRMRNSGRKGPDGKRLPTPTPDPRVFKPGYVILEGDYETATDFIEWGAARHVCKRYLRHL